MSSTDVPAEVVSDRIRLIRNARVMLDADLAALYGVSKSSGSSDRWPN